MYNHAANVFQLLQDVEASSPAVSFRSGHSSLNDPDSVKLAFLPFKTMVCTYLLPQRPSKTEQLPTAGLMPPKQCPSRSRPAWCMTHIPVTYARQASSLMPHLQTPLVKEKRENLHLLLASSVYCLQGRSRAIPGQHMELRAG